MSNIKIIDEPGGVTTLVLHDKRHEYVNCSAHEGADSIKFISSGAVYVDRNQTKALIAFMQEWVNYIDELDAPLSLPV